VDWFKVTLIILWAALTGLISRSYYLDIKKPKGLSVEVSDFIVIAGCVAGGSMNRLEDGFKIDSAFSTVC
jgi:hypothetical protein